MKKSHPKISQGIKHRIPQDVKDILVTYPKLLEAWNSLTPIARNEWICWIISVKKDETRQKHLARFQEELLQGKKRPCCWPGCPHRG